MVNYYAKYNLTRDVRRQEEILRTALKTSERMVRVIEDEISRYTKAIENLEANTELEESIKIKRIAELKDRISHNQDMYFDKMDIIRIVNNTFAEDGERDETDSLAQDERITSEYILIRLYKSRKETLLRKERDALRIKNPEEREKALEEIREEDLELQGVYNLLSNPETRREYDIKVNRMEYLAKLERDNLARIKLSEEHVKSILGDEFNPDMSSIGEKMATLTRRRASNPVFGWEARLYQRPEKLFVGRSQFPEMSKLDRDVYAFRYGTIEFSSMFRENGEPTYRDNLSEIIGITKIDQDGQERTDFVIAPLTDSGLIKEVTQSEYERLIMSKAEPIIVKTSEDIQAEENLKRFLEKRIPKGRPNISRKSKEAPKGFWKGITEGLRAFVIGEDLEDEFLVEEDSTPQRYSSKVIDFQTAIDKRNDALKANIKEESKQHVFIQRTVKHVVRPEELEFFTNVYFSDYLVENAVKNNAGYLGSYSIANGQRIVSFNAPLERERIAACFYASKKPGKIHQMQKFEGIPSYITSASNTGSLFAYLESEQRKLVETERKSKVQSQGLAQSDSLEEYS